MINENKPTIPIWCLNIGDNFTMNGSNVKGELLSCPDCGDANVKLVKGTKIERLTWSRESLVVPVTRSEMYVESSAIENSKNESNKIVNKVEKSNNTIKTPKMDKYGCKITSVSGKINATMSSVPQSLQDIALKIGVSKERVAVHFSDWKKKNRGIALVLMEKDEKYWIKS